MSTVVHNGSTTVTVFNTFGKVDVMLSNEVDGGGDIMLLDRDARFVADVLNSRIKELDGEVW